MKRPKTSVIYDLDGTIADTERFHLEAWAVTAEKYSLLIPPSDIHLSSLGTSTLSTLRVLFPDLEESLREEIASFKFATLTSLIENSKVELMPGFYETWKSLPALGLNIGICTAARAANVLALEKSGGQIGEILTSLGGEIVSKEMCEKGKPCPDPLLLAIKLAGAKRTEEVVYVGDAPADRECARRAGVEYVHFGTVTHSHSSSSPVIQDHRELLGILEKSYQ